MRSENHTLFKLGIWRCFGSFVFSLAALAYRLTINILL